MGQLMCMYNFGMLIICMSGMITMSNDRAHKSSASTVWTLKRLTINLNTSAHLLCKTIIMRCREFIRRVNQNSSDGKGYFGIVENSLIMLFQN